MDILSFILGLQKGKSMGSDGSDSGEWISASGTFTPTSNTVVLEHNLGVVPDIFFIHYFNTAALTGSSSLFMCGMILSKKLMGDASNTGYSFLFNPNAKTPVILGFGTGGLEAQSAGSLGGIGGATATQITLGSSSANLITTGGEYKWTAYAKK